VQKNPPTKSFDADYNERDYHYLVPFDWVYDKVSMCKVKVILNKVS
jgi:hypothetical protein